MTNAVKRTPTNRELVPARQAQAPMAAVAPAAKVPAPVTPTSVPYRNRYLDEVAPSGIAGRLIKFNKDGAYVTIDDDQEVAENAEFILLADDTLVGWIKFNGVGGAGAPHGPALRRLRGATAREPR
jgi:hypothetical protein